MTQLPTAIFFVLVGRCLGKGIIGNRAGLLSEKGGDKCAGEDDESRDLYFSDYGIPQLRIPLKKSGAVVQFKSLLALKKYLLFHQ